MLRYKKKTEIARFSRLVWHPARKRSGSILTTPKPAWGSYLHSQGLCPLLLH